MDYSFLDINLCVIELREQLKWDIAQDVITGQAKAIMKLFDKKELLRGKNEVDAYYLITQAIITSNENGDLLDLMLSSQKFDMFLKAAFEVDYTDFSYRYIEKVFAYSNAYNDDHGMGVFDVFDEIKSKELFMKNPKLLKDIRRIFIKIGDIELFIRCNLANAIRCYKSADIYEYCMGTEEPLIPLSEDEWLEVVTWHTFVGTFKTSTLASNLKFIINCGEEDLANGAFKKREQFNFNLDYSGRLLQGSYLAFYAAYSVPVLAGLLGKDKSFSKALTLFELNRGIAYQEVFEVLDEKNEKDKREFLCKMAKLLLTVSEIKKLLRIKNLDEDPLFYTSMRTFSYMLPDACRDDYSKCGKLSIMHVSYMNDPTEGRVLFKRLGNEELSNESKMGRIVANTTYVFMKCFTNQMDYLPMWEIYGDNAEGCCIVLDKEQFVGSNRTNDLFRVCYLDTENTVTRINNPAFSDKEINQLENGLHSLEESVRVLASNEIECIKACLADIRHLFKDSSYSYEQEMRIVRTYDTKNDDFQHTKSNDPIINSPLLFVYSRGSVQIKEIILGPKFHEISYRIPYLQEQLEELSNITKNKMPIITKSSIRYR